MDIDTLHSPIFESTYTQAIDDNVIECIYCMAELQLRIWGHPITDAEMEALVERYLLIDSAAFLCKTSPAFSEHVDNDELMNIEAMNDKKDEDVVEEFNAFSV